MYIYFKLGRLVGLLSINDLTLIECFPRHNSSDTIINQSKTFDAFFVTIFSPLCVIDMSR